jgi:hypothetical protein
MKMRLNAEERALLMAALESNRDGKADVKCDTCNSPIVVLRDNNGRALQSSCDCGKFNSTFRPI